ncbi:hypothetical protein GCK32_017873 [Trichostrongylus colubriformis]|uniref:Pectinesterase inhibitor domain-containing protein n=1 Tax=Trichostrongylus colubriformis TaxID=6319 RepID=A0AAN8F067_TRICO
MLFYVLIAFIALNVFTGEGVMAQTCQDMIPSLCSNSYRKYCNDDILGNNSASMLASLLYSSQNGIDDRAQKTQIALTKTSGCATLAGSMAIRLTADMDLSRAIELVIADPSIYPILRQPEEADEDGGGDRGQQSH